MQDQQEHLIELAQVSLNTFAAIANKAAEKISQSVHNHAEGIANINTFTGSSSVNAIAKSSNEVREGYESLEREPAIARVVAEDEKGNRHVYYISRSSSLVLDGGIALSSYNAPIGKLAATQIGDEAKIAIANKQCRYIVVEKIKYNPKKVDGQWDSAFNIFEHEELTPQTIDSLRRFLGSGVAEEDIFAILNSGAEIGDGITQGIKHQIRSAMALRDQPILDQFQDSIFRLPLDSQLIILGPPGTGKTTTLIKRLGQKLDTDYLDEDEKRLAQLDVNGVLHKNSWLMFTPTELLKHYVKEAFNRESVPASDEHIKTWESFRRDLARNILGILRSESGGKFIEKKDVNFISTDTISDPRGWFKDFSEHHKQQVITQLKNGIEILRSVESHPPVISQLVVEVQSLAINHDLVGFYSTISRLESALVPLMVESKKRVDDAVRKEGNRLHNQNKDIFKNLATFLASLDTSADEEDDDEQFDEEVSDEAVAPTFSELAKAAQTYAKFIKTFSRNIYSKKSLAKSSKSSKIRDWLGERLPENTVLLDIGEKVSFQNGLRRFINASKRYVSEVPTSYRSFRKNPEKFAFYRSIPTNSAHIDSAELDLLVLTVLRNARELLAIDFIVSNLNDARFNHLSLISSNFKNQILVDEATDFSVLQLAAMEGLTNLKTRSFFACGDFNQRITGSGVRTIEQFKWISNRVQEQRIVTVYRQSKKLNDFAHMLVKSLGGDLSALGKLPQASNHQGFAPVLAEGLQSNDQVAEWLCIRIREIERSLGQLPTVAVLVSSEKKVQPLTNSLNDLLEEVNLNAVACVEGKSLGNESSVRVFDIQHIKGLEFEAVFFIDVDQLANEFPELFDRYLYVGSTRAATYLGVSCRGSLPEKLMPIKDRFSTQWS